ncbi:hypothetical protein GCM10023235_11650 [Kitasatospora terrestris]|uniref:Uncharacterized protein n=1 Tax=Kitasatospora terrestris TaxID=258051 RepID=A0ABP9DDQ5_9ACTN
MGPPHAVAGPQRCLQKPVLGRSGRQKAVALVVTLGAALVKPVVAVREIPKGRPLFVKKRRGDRAAAVPALSHRVGTRPPIVEATQHTHLPRRVIRKTPPNAT